VKVKGMRAIKGLRVQRGNILMILMRLTNHYIISVFFYIFFLSFLQDFFVILYTSDIVFDRLGNTTMSPTTMSYICYHVSTLLQILYIILKWLVLWRV